ncbi:phage tail assembly protein T [Sphingobium sp. TCM1]|nr:hypothetical protein [Sphingobium sp. TCM1]
MALGKSLAEIAAMPLSEFTTWFAFYELEPWGCPVEDQRAETQLNVMVRLGAQPGTKVPTFFDRWPKKEEVKAAPQVDLTLKIKGFFAAYEMRQNKKNPAAQ